MGFHPDIKGVYLRTEWSICLFLISHFLGKKRPKELAWSAAEVQTPILLHTTLFLQETSPRVYISGTDITTYALSHCDYREQTYRLNTLRGSRNATYLFPIRSYGLTTD